VLVGGGVIDVGCGVGRNVVGRNLIEDGPIDGLREGSNDTIMDSEGDMDVTDSEGDMDVACVGFTEGLSDVVPGGARGGSVVGTTVGSRVGGGDVLFAMKAKSSEHKQVQ